MSSFQGLSSISGLSQFASVAVVTIEELTVTSTMSSGVFSILIQDNSGYGVTVFWWDNTSSTIETLGAPTYIEKNIVSPYNTSDPKLVRIRPVNADKIPFGNITRLSANGGDSGIVAVDVSLCTNMDKIELNSTGISSLDISGLTNLTVVNLANNSSLSSLSAVGVGGQMSDTTYYSSYSFGNGFNLNYCNFDSTALEQFYTDLVATSGANILLFGYMDVGDTTIATNKGYAVFT